MTSTTWEEQVVQEAKTLGLSPKAILAFMFPLIGAVIGAACDWIVSGQFDVTTIRTALAGLGASGLALLGAWIGKPGKLTVRVKRRAAHKQPPPAAGV